MSGKGHTARHMTERGTCMIQEKCVLKVLLIEDNPDLLEILGDLVTLLGHAVATATSGHEGLVQALRFQPDVITCDIGLPDISGYEVARMVRQNPVLKDTLLIAMSGYAQPDDLERSRSAGFNRHLAKPVSIDLLSEAIDECQRCLYGGTDDGAGDEASL